MRNTNRPTCDVCWGRPRIVCARCEYLDALGDPWPTEAEIAAVHAKWRRAAQRFTVGVSNGRAVTAVTFLWGDTVGAVADAAAAQFRHDTAPVDEPWTLAAGGQELDRQAIARDAIQEVDGVRRAALVPITVTWRRVTPTPWGAFTFPVPPDTRSRLQ